MTARDGIDWAALRPVVRRVSGSLRRSARNGLQWGQHISEGVLPDNVLRQLHHWRAKFAAAWSGNSNQGTRAGPAEDEPQQESLGRPVRLQDLRRRSGDNNVQWYTALRRAACPICRQPPTSAPYVAQCPDRHIACYVCLHSLLSADPGAECVECRAPFQGGQPVPLVLTGLAQLT